MQECLFILTRGVVYTNADERRLNALSEEIIGAAFEVSNVLGAGFLEKVYENALNVELNFSKPKVEIKRIVNGI